MARARNIKPGFYQNEDLAQCSALARLIFPGLWMMADRDGRLEDRPLKIKATLLPFDNADADALLGELADREFINRYTVGGRKCIQILNFSRHQKPHHREPESTIPAQTKPRQRPRKAAAEPGNGTASPPPSRAESPTLESPIPLPDSPSLNPLPPEAGLVGFDQFWDAWPKKAAKAAAVKAWKKLSPSGVLQTRILADVRQRSQSPQWLKDSGQFIPHASTYLAGRRWEDELTPCRQDNLRQEILKNGTEFIRRGEIGHDAE